MAGFADAFSAENVNKLMADPRLLMGLQLLQQSGPQQGNPGAGARIGQAGIGAMQQIAQQQHSQQLQQYRQQMIAAQQAELAQRVQTAQQKADEQKQWQQRLQDPAFLQTLGPMARQMAQLGVNPSDLLRATAADNLAQHRQAQLAQQAQQFDQRQAHVGAGGGQPSGPKIPTPRQLIEEPLPDGTIQKHLYDAATQSYKPYGAPYNPHSTRGAGKQKADPLDSVLNAINGGTPGDDPDEPAPGLGSLPGTGGLQSYAPQQNPAPSVIAAGAVPNAAQQSMRVPGQAKPAKPMTKAEYDALPVGAMYQDPVSGKIAAKKAR